MKGNQTVPISASIPVKISCKQVKPNADHKLLQRQSINKDLSDNSDKNANNENFIGTPESDYNLESDIVNLECTILSNILDHHHNSSFRKEDLGNINFELDKIPDLSGYIDSIGRPFCNYNAYDTSASGDIINQAHQYYNSNNDISDNWIKGGLAAPNVVKPSLNNIVSQEQMAMSETNNLPFTLDNANLNPSKFSSSSIYTLDHKPHQDNRALIRLYDIMTQRYFFTYH
ncbi:hypothetical protein AYI69_g4520 [Smittium culicis]|uniref:Uncharacterized protein n=1 Tax=Smittium culicis TaxID=133412 RepID=A0A1R1YCZ5_9FUNG|nr:hypothetical protein AYI69_g4520 [Smittium culicis]